MGEPERARQQVRHVRQGPRSRPRIRREREERPHRGAGHHHDPASHRVLADEVMKPLGAFSMLVAAALAAVPGIAQAQQKFPTKPVRLVVPFSPGGGTDTLSRIIGQKMSESWGQSVVIENRTGAGGTIGTGIVAKATPDGHTLLVSS